MWCNQWAVGTVSKSALTIVRSGKLDFEQGKEIVHKTLGLCSLLYICFGLLETREVMNYIRISFAATDDGNRLCQLLIYLYIYLTTQNIE